MEQHRGSRDSSVVIEKIERSARPITLDKPELRELLFEHAASAKDENDLSMLVATPRSYIGVQLADINTYNAYDRDGYYQDYVLPVHIKKVIRTRTVDGKRLPNRPQTGDFRWMSVMSELPLVTTPNAAWRYLKNQEFADPTEQLPPIQILGRAAIETTLKLLKSKLPEVRNKDEREFLSKYSTYWALEYLSRTYTKAT
jgi:hypothetical protein